MNMSSAINHGAYHIKKYMLWNHYYNNVPYPKHKGPVVNTQDDIQKIVKDLRSNSFDVKEYKINVAEYKKYLIDAHYQTYEYYTGNNQKNFTEKSLEHFIALKLLGLSKNDVYIDIANCDSPTPDIYNSLTGCTVYKQDLEFPKGVHGNVIGGDAGNLPVSDGFASKMALHCSFEHFEGDADIRFIREAGRVLQSGGKVCILPFYLSNKYAIQNDPAWALIDIEKDATCYCAKGYRTRHGRFYDVPHLISRIKNNLGELKLTIYVVQNEKDVDPSCYVKFIGVFEKSP